MKNCNWMHQKLHYKYYRSNPHSFPCAIPLFFILANQVGAPFCDQRKVVIQLPRHLKAKMTTPS